jgi:hypothetical protein
MYIIIRSFEIYGGNTMKRMLILMASAVTVLLIGCASSFPSDQLHKEKAIEGIEKRAEFDMDCKDVISTLLGDITRLGQQMTSMSIGVSGCDKKATYYTECVSNWGKITCTPRLNSISKSSNSDESD